jgi:hypothetical protein
MQDNGLNASFWIAIFFQTMGSVDPMPGTGPRKMPAPAAYVPVIIVWAVLGLASDMGFERPAAIFGWLMTLSALVLGPFGKKLSKFVNWIGQEYGPQGAAASGSPQNPIVG